MRSVQITPAPPCPKCRTKLDSALGISGRRVPQVGDFTVCFSCGTLLRFTEALDLCELRDGDLDDIHPDDANRLLYARDMIIELKQKGR